MVEDGQVLFQEFPVLFQMSANRSGLCQLVFFASSARRIFCHYTVFVSPAVRNGQRMDGVCTQRIGWFWRAMAGLGSVPGRTTTIPSSYRHTLDYY